MVWISAIFNGLVLMLAVSGLVIYLKEDKMPFLCMSLLCFFSIGFIFTVRTW